MDIYRLLYISVFVVIDTCMHYQSYKWSQKACKKKRSIHTLYHLCVYIQQCKAMFILQYLVQLFDSSSVTSYTTSYTSLYTCMYPIETRQPKTSQGHPFKSLKGKTLHLNLAVVFFSVFSLSWLRPKSYCSFCFRTMVTGHPYIRTLHYNTLHCIYITLHDLT